MHPSYIITYCKKRRTLGQGVQSTRRSHIRLQHYLDPMLSVTAALCVVLPRFCRDTLSIGDMDMDISVVAEFINKN